LIENILTYQSTSGGFAISRQTGEITRPRTPDIDLTAMAVTALAPYKHNATVNEAIENAVDFLANAQSPEGGYINYNINNAESLSQVIIALCAAGVALDDPRFVKNDRCLAETLALFKMDNGHFSRERSRRLADPIATRQGALALTAIRQAETFDAMNEEERKNSGLKRGIFE
jgi:hypothetical protein